MWSNRIENPAYEEPAIFCWIQVKFLRWQHAIRIMFLSEFSEGLLLFISLTSVLNEVKVPLKYILTGTLKKEGLDLKR